MNIERKASESAWLLDIPHQAVQVRHRYDLILGTIEWDASG